ncbi:hypothetical protein ACP70R_039165 [Stipagrostis hirtigluma subsp. patula]
MLDSSTDLEKVSTYLGPLLDDGERSYFVVAAYLEAGIAQYEYGRVDVLGSGGDLCSLLPSMRRQVNDTKYNGC